MPCVQFMPHQTEAIQALHNGCILCGGVGTGKSITALGYYYICVCKGVMWAVKDGEENIGPMTEPKKLYIITTARKRDTGEWAEECRRFELTTEDDDVIIDSWNNLHKYESITNAFFIFDEQRVVGSGSWVKSFLKVTRANEWILLTATPGDTWMDYIPVFIANGFYKNRTQFLRRHAVYNQYSMYPKVDRWLEPGYLEFLRRKITVSMYYEKKTEPHWSEMYVPYDKKLYDRIVKDRWDPWNDAPIENISEACYLMRKAAGHYEQRAREVFWLVMAKHPRAIIFYNYDYELEDIRETFATMLQFDDVEGRNKDFKLAEWNGHRHEEIPTTKYWAYLVQYNAGAEGWNCVETDTIIFYSQNYSYKMMTQAAGRIDRLNTPYSDLYYYVLKTKAPIDGAISRALKTKRNFNERVFARKLGYQEAKTA